jgi:DNA polymerase-1
MQDNIPGLPGVGEKTAKKFLAEYGSMENLANTHELKGAIKTKIEANKELGLLSKISYIFLDCPCLTKKIMNFRMLKKKNRRTI